MTNCSALQASAIGLIDEILKDVALDYGSHYFSGSGRCFLKVEPTTREYGFPRRNAFAQPTLEATLRAAMGRFSNVEALFGHHAGVVAEDGDHVALSLTGPNGVDRTIRARYLVACDGARSAIRKHIGASLGGSTYRERWLILDLASTKERLRQTRVVCDPHRPLITLPAPNGTRRYEFMLADGEDETLAGSPEFARELLGTHGPDATAPILRQRVYAFHARIADRWNTSRIFLAGDAAHLSPPFAGQGMNSGIRDAFNLGWKLSEVIRGRIGPSVLASYQRERAPHAWAMIELAMNMGRVMMPRSHWQALAMRLGFNAARCVPPLQSYLAEMRYKPQPRYDDGFQVPGHGRPELVGRMMPQPKVELVDRRRKMLDEELGRGFALIAYGPQSQKVAASAAKFDFGLPDLRILAMVPRSCNPDLDLSTEIGTVRALTGYCATPFFKENSVMIVRPDRHVLAATTAESANVCQLASAVRDLVTRTWGRSERRQAA